MYSIKVNDNQRRKQMPYQVLYAVDTLDTNPSVDLFDTFREAEDFVSDEVRRRVDHIVEHSPFPVSAGSLPFLSRAAEQLFAINCSSQAEASGSLQPGNRAARASGNRAFCCLALYMQQTQLRYRYMRSSSAAAARKIIAGNLSRLNPA